MSLSVSTSVIAGVRVHTLRKPAQQQQAQQWGVVSRGFAGALQGYSGTHRGTLYAVFATQQAAQQYHWEHDMRLYATVMQIA